MIRCSIKNIDKLQKFLKTTSEVIHDLERKPPVPSRTSFSLPLYLGESVEAKFLARNLRFDVQRGKIIMGFSSNATLGDRTSMQVYDDLLKLEQSDAFSGTPAITLLRNYARRVIVPYVRTEIERRLRRA